MQQKKPEEVEEAVVEVLEAAVVMVEVAVVMEQVVVVMVDMEVHQVVVAVEVEEAEAAVVVMADSDRQEGQHHHSLRNLDTIINYEALEHCETDLNSTYQSLGLII